MIKYLYIVIVVIGILVLSYIPSLSLPFIVKGMIYFTIFLLVVLIIKIVKGMIYFTIFLLVVLIIKKISKKP